MPRKTTQNSIKSNPTIGSLSLSYSPNDETANLSFKDETLTLNKNEMIAFTYMTAKAALQLKNSE